MTINSPLFAGDCYKELLKLVENPCARGGKKIPLLYKVVAGREATDSEALELANRAFVDWVRVHRKVRLKSSDNCPYYSPSSTMTSIRSLLAYLMRACGWVICFDDMRGFDGSLDAVLKDLFHQRQKDWVSLHLKLIKFMLLLLTFVFV